MAASAESGGHPRSSAATACCAAQSVRSGHRGAVQLQDADLRVKGVPVGGGDLGDARLARQHPAHVGQAESQLA
jgi:hypothetical protein